MLYTHRQWLNCSGIGGGSLKIHSAQYYVDRPVIFTAVSTSYTFSGRVLVYN